MQRIDTVRPFAGGYIAYGVSDGGDRVTIPLTEVRASVAWPASKNPGYYIILGKKAQRNPLGKSPLMFLTEGEDYMPTALYRKLMDDTVKMHAFVIYADQGADRGRSQSACYTDLFDFLGSSNIGLAPAPSASDEEYGVVLVREFLRDKILELPQYRMTTIMNELRAMTGDADLKDFYAFKALRYLLAGFVKYQETPPDWSNVKPPVVMSPVAWT